MSNDEIIALAKEQVSYERHVSLVGKEKADNILWFWIHGFRYAMKNIQSKEL